MPRCPLCRTPTELIKYEAVPVHSCGTCGGHWLTEVKLDAILRRREIDMPAPVKQKVVELAAEANSGQELLCLSCGTPMIKEPFKHWSDITLDRCRKCNGLWLDRHELEKCQVYWEYLQDHPEAAGIERIEKLATVEAELIARQIELRDRRDRAELSRQALRRPGMFNLFF
jgi:Zn-finger nucleic acid-binding protein